MPRARRHTGARSTSPKLTEGGWVRCGAVVVEAAFADALGVGAGDRITLDGRAVPGRGRRGHGSHAAVPGGARLTAPAPLPGGRQDDRRPGLADRAGCSRVCRGTGSLAYVLNLKLADPAAAPAFVERARLRRAEASGPRRPDSPPTPLLQPWQEIRDNAYLVGAQRTAGPA